MHTCTLTSTSAPGHAVDDVELQEYASTSAYEDEQSEMAVTKVWVVMGGEGLQRQHSLKSGLHACLMLQNNPELQVYMLPLMSQCGYAFLLLYMNPDLQACCFVLCPCCFYTHLHHYKVAS